LLTGLVHISSAVGVVIAVGELAVGLGTLVGLWSRVAAGGGMAISLGLFLSVSYHSSPYFTGSDIVFFFAWTPLLLAGAGGAPALDTWLLARSHPASSGAGGLSRREVAVAGLVAGLVVVTGGATALVGRLIGGSGSAAAGAGFGTGASPTTPTSAPITTAAPASSTTTTTPPVSIPPGKKLGSASKVPVGGSATFTDPGSGDPGLVIQATSGHFVAFDAICPHAGCTVAYQRGAKVIACPCHGSEFNAETGAVMVGPADRGLTVIPVQAGTDGNLYVDG
jgi:thiosulfate dehydrogenase [quinone] large subunit